MAQQQAPDPMVMMAQMLQQMQVANQNTTQLIQQNQQAMEQRDVALRQALGLQREETAQSVRALSETLAKISTKEKNGVVDVKGVGKPEMLQGETKEQIKQKWPLWSFGFTTWFVSQYEQADEMLKWAAAHNGAIDERALSLEVATRDGWDEAARVSRQLHTALVSLTKGETLSILRNSVAQSGFDGWRRLSREYEPQTAQSNYHLLAKVLRPTKAKDLSGLRGAIETWERLYTQYQERTSDALSDPTRRLCLQSLCPDSLAEHLDLHASRLASYDAMRAEIDTYLDIKTSVPAPGFDPMDVDAMAKGKAKGKSGKGKGGSQNNVTCHACGRFGHFAKDCWNPKGGKGKGNGGKDGKGKKSDGKGKWYPKGSKGKDSKGKGKPGVKSLEGGDQESNDKGAEAEIQAIFALEENPELKPRAESGRERPTGKGRGKGTGSTEVFIRTVLTNLRSVESREIHRAKAELGRGKVDESRRQKLESEIAERRQQLEVLKGRSARFEEDPRYRQDVRAGRNVRLSKRKWKSRVRAAEHRAKGSAGRAVENVQLNELWHTKFRGPKKDLDWSKGVEARRTHQIDRHGGRFEGDREDLQPDWVMRSLSYKERKEFRQEDDEPLEEVKARSWSKPQWMKRNTAEAKRKHMKRTGWRLGMLRQRSKAKRAKALKESEESSARKGSFRPFPAEKDSERKGPDLELLAEQAWSQKKAKVEDPNLESLADMAWSRKEIKVLSQSLELAEDDREAAELEERIKVHKAKIASLGPKSKSENEPSSTACGSRDTPQERYEEIAVEEEAPTGKPVADNEPHDPSEESEDETWGSWKPSQCLVDLGFSEQEAKRLVQHYSKGSVESLEIFSMDEPAADGEWEKVYVTVDSGAAVTCFPESLVQGYQVGDHSGPKQYTSASNHEVTALGSAKPVISFEDWQVNKVEAVVLSPLKRPLFSTSRMVAAGWRIVHDSEENGGSFALHRASGRKLKMNVMGGVYKMPVWVKRKQVFGRRGHVP